MTCESGIMPANYFSALNATSKFLKDEGYDCYGYVVDVSQKEMVYQVAKRVKEEVGKVNIICNNAGVVTCRQGFKIHNRTNLSMKMIKIPTCRTFLELPDKAIEQTYGVNILSHYWVNIDR